MGDEPLDGGALPATPRCIGPLAPVAAVRALSDQASRGATSAGSPARAGATPASSPSVTWATSKRRSARTRSIATRIGVARRLVSTGSNRASASARARVRAGRLQSGGGSVRSSTPGGGAPS